MSTLAVRHEIFRKSGLTLMLIGAMIAMGWVFVEKGPMLVMLGVAFPILMIFILTLFKNPQLGYWILFVLNYFVLGIARYLSAPLGLAIDSLLLLSHLGIFIRYFYDKEIYRKAKSDLMLLAGIWYLYALFQLVNPEAVSRVAWFYAMRGVALHMALVIPLIMIMMDNEKDLDRIFKVLSVLAVLGVLKGMQQKFLGCDPWEQRWLDNGGALTHVLFGKLRVFSFFSDAGQYGAHMGHMGVVFSILAMNAPTRKKKIIFTIVAILTFYGMLISGTRGAMAVPIAGFTLYIILQKNIRMMVAGGTVGLIFYIFIFHTTIGQSNYDIARLRTAFDKDNPSLQVRLENQKKLKVYMKTRPFGGGIGSSGNWGQRFTPNTFLANTPTDSWYVMIWAEQGVVGLYLHLFILFYIIIKSSYRIMFVIKDPWLNARLQALAAGMLGIMAASYGNGVLGQMPSGIIIYTSMAYMFLGPRLDEKIRKKTEKNENLIEEKK
ncbi:MAG: O-antigen ligase family protein [Bacteroidales bacterium]